MAIDLSEDQKKVVKTLLDWYKTENKVFITMGGYAGTGKTTVISVLAHLLRKDLPADKKLKISYVAYTGKASRVLRTKLESQKTLTGDDYIGTIHSLIYSPLTNDKEEIIGWERKKDLATDLIIVDEASMVDQSIWNDLLIYKIPIIAVGDHGQLPPISGKFNLMQTPMVKLEKIHRQVEDSPIIKLSYRARVDGNIPFGKFSDQVMKIDRGDSESMEIIEDNLKNQDQDIMVLCGFNQTRVKLNKYVRNLMEIDIEEPVGGDKVICLRNNHKKQIYNGMIGTIATIDRDDERDYFVEIYFNENEKYKGNVLKSQFGALSTISFTDKRSSSIESDLFDFGYALTVHKAQGSQAKKIMLFEERSGHMDDEMWRRWLYTAVTRAEEQLIIVGRQ